MRKVLYRHWYAINIGYCDSVLTRLIDKYGPNLFACAPQGGDNPKWCCGPNATECCDSGKGFEIPVGSVFLRANQIPTASTSQTSSIITPTTTSHASLNPSTVTSTPSSNASLNPSTVTSTPSSNASLNPNTMTSTPSSNTSLNPNTMTSNPSSTHNNSLSIGLGVGIPLGIIAIGTLAFLAWELRRHNNIQERTRASPAPAYQSRKSWWKNSTIKHAEELDGQNEAELDHRNQIYELSQQG